MIYLEQKAEEHAASEIPFDTTESGEKLYTKNDLKEAYISGAKESIIWHNLKENPDDLPKGNGLFVIYWKLGDIDNYMIFRGTIGDLHKDVVAWCELPKYEV